MVRADGAITTARTAVTSHRYFPRNAHLAGVITRPDLSNDSLPAMVIIFASFSQSTGSMVWTEPSAIRNVNGWPGNG